MKHKQWPIHIWFLDKDLQKSAEFLTDKFLLKSIDGCIGSLLSTIFYFIGIRSRKFYDYFFSKEQIDATMDRFFKNLPMKKKPSFSPYGWKESKWCRSCHENFDCCKKYLELLVQESDVRNCFVHSHQEFIDWMSFDAPKLDFSYAGIDDVVFPWKVINPKFRKIDIIDGYRAQYANMFENIDDVFNSYMHSPHDIPEFVLNNFQYENL